MPCFSPNVALRHRFEKQKLRWLSLKGYRLKDGSCQVNNLVDNPYFDLKVWEPLVLPCGKCLWCRLQAAKEKAIRCLHESKESEDNCFLTLTYKNVPASGSYDMRDLQLFMKRLRFENRGKKIKSFGCAEYGDKFSRPHFHLLLFNHNFSDREYWRTSKNDWSPKRWRVDRSAALERLWPHGFSEIGSVTFESAGYVARYINKKVSGDKSVQHYDGKLPERAVAVSQGIGLEWFRRYHDECLVSDSLLVKGKECRIPRYYLKKLEKFAPAKYLALKEKRLAKFREIDLDGTKERLAVQKEILLSKFRRLKRSYEE